MASPSLVKLPNGRLLAALERCACGSRVLTAAAATSYFHSSLASTWRPCGHKARVLCNIQLHRHLWCCVCVQVCFVGRDPGDHNEADLQQQRWWGIMAARCLGWPHELAAGGAARCWLGTVFSQVLWTAWSSSMQADQHSMLLINLHCSFSHVPVVFTCWARSATSRPITIWSSPKCWTRRVRVLVVCALLRWRCRCCPSVLDLCSSPRLQLELQMCLSCLDS